MKMRSNTFAKLRVHLGEFRREFLRSRVPAEREIRRAVRLGMIGDIPRHQWRKNGSVWAISMVRNEADVIEMMIQHLEYQGFDGLIIADNMSEDDTYNKILNYQGNLRVHLLKDQEFRFYQGAKISFLAKIARRLGAEWIIPVDADEFWFATGGTVKEFLKERAEKKVSAVIHNIYPTDIEGIFRVDLHPHPYKHIAFKSYPTARVSEGSHSVKRPGNSADGLHLLHLPWRSREQMAAKVRTSSLAMTAANLSGIDGHWMDMAEFSNQEMDRIWNCIMGRSKNSPDFGYKPVGPFSSLDISNSGEWINAIAVPPPHE